MKTIAHAKETHTSSIKLSDYCLKMGNYFSESITNSKDVDLSPGRIGDKKYIYKVYSDRKIGKYNFDVSEKLEVVGGVIGIPSEIIHEILLYLNLADLFKIYQCSRVFFQIAHTQYFWRRRFQICFNHSFSLAEEHFDQEDRKKRSWKKLFFIEWCRQSGDEGYQTKFHVVPRENKGPYGIDAPLGDEAKIVFLGESFVGKTSFIYRFVENKFDQDHYSTIGMEFQTKRLMSIETGRTIRLDLWDSAGEERYRSLTPVFYRNSLGAIVMFSIDNFQSFNRAKEWVSEYQRHFVVNKKKEENRPARIVLVGNKCDLEEKREVLSEEAKDYAKEKESICGYVETSAKLGKNIWVAVCLLAENIMKDEKKFLEVQKEEEVDLLGDKNNDPGGGGGCVVM